MIKIIAESESAEITEPHESAGSALNNNKTQHPVSSSLICSVNISVDILQMWGQWRAWLITELGTLCTGPAPPRPPSPGTRWTSGAAGRSTARPWSPWPRTTIPTCWPWMNAKSRCYISPTNPNSSPASTNTSLF